MDFGKNLEMTYMIECGSHAISVIMTHCIRKSICDLHLTLIV